MIVLIGIVKKNLIMMVDFALDAVRRERKAAQESYRGGVPRSTFGRS
jgi:multidrug efflux pump subunit AcrB